MWGESTASAKSEPLQKLVYSFLICRPILPDLSDIADLKIIQNASKYDYFIIIEIKWDEGMVANDRPIDIVVLNLRSYIVGYQHCKTCYRYFIYCSNGATTQFSRGR